MDLIKLSHIVKLYTCQLFYDRLLGQFRYIKILTWLRGLGE